MSTKSYAFSVVLLIVCLFFYAICDGKEIPLTFVWDSNRSIGQWQQIKIFVRINGNSYDYNMPLIEVSQSYDNGQSTPTEAKVNFNFPDNNKTTAYFVARSYDNNGKFSEDSNEVVKIVDLLPLEAFDFDASYNADDSSINFIWEITDVRGLRYRIYKSYSENGDFEPFRLINYIEGQTNYSDTIAIDSLFPANEKTTVYFKMIVWGGSGDEIISSPDTKIIPITLDRRENAEVDKVINFKLILE